MKIGFLGTGNMGGAIMRGYGKDAEKNGDKLLAYNRTREKLEAACAESGAEPVNSMKELIEGSDIVVLAMEPKTIRSMIDEIAADFSAGKLLVSVAAGIAIGFFEEHLGEDAMIVRVMPNMAVKIGEGMTSVSRNTKVTDRSFTKVLQIFEGVGRAEEVDEDMIDTVIGVSGSSPAYTYMYLDALARAAEKNGMEYDQALRFAAQAVIGAAKFALTSDESLDDLRKAMCTEGGTTIEAYKVLAANGFAADAAEGFQAAVDRSREMTKGK
ncbi:MAG: pyrroline-5-carboxylate reductase [Eubacteriaceae bacterium]|jgi:pyrroline-5-carboxylate reductase|nr:pyrroline-5-carboxylate reductase [Eubacteriaceae bacterium]